MDYTLHLLPFLLLVCLAPAVGCGSDPQERRGSIYELKADPTPENLERMEEGMLEVAASLVSEPPAAADVAGAFNRGEGRGRMRRLSRIGQAYALAMAELRGRDPRHLDAGLPALRAVTPEDVVAAARAHLAFDLPITTIAR